ncbi:PAS domain S-box-containing protein [Desulfomicrobium norvegicum]|uniref:HTH-type transcriptional regulatory protein TyrR n=1 Tax=Desulfomicrobium norvegicum (strain DSM 1741 / NCIMB 8310) TaxID=52561 RepID=A0A8G2C0Q4_DESNO|nr:sigma 54-interacting transcriptional regulator [Desulfomicrobium norvegicum]SFL40885.1 PAS domain S-box-containing protein [Desulfomicrobium norvegicum]
MKVRDIMQVPVKVLRERTTLREAASFFRREMVRGVQVVDERGFSAGVFSYEELLNALATGSSLSDAISLHVRPMMCSVHPDTDIEELKRYGSSFLTVVDGSQILGGIDMMAVDDILRGGTISTRIPVYEVLMDMPEAAFLVDEKCCVRWINTTAGIWCTKEPTDVLGKKLAQVLTEEGFEIEVDPLDGQSIIIAWRDETRFLPITWPARFPDGSQKRIVLLRDVQEDMLRAREIAKLRSMSKELDAIIDSSFDGIFITDGNGRALRVNRAYERITGIRAKEVMGRPMAELVTEGFYDESVTLKVLQSRRIETIIQKVRDSKTIVVTGNPIFDDDGEIWRVVTNVRDVTELRKLQQELERLAELQNHYQRELDTLRRNINPNPEIIIRSKKMREIHDQAMRLAQVDSSVLITGESGVGKEVVARLIHDNSHRHRGPFVKISCAAIPEQLLESELFGYKAGAFTGALRSGKQGVFETANGGTLFLDEIGEMPLGLQAKLLRVLQERTIVPVGGVRETPIDVRIIAATNRDLDDMVQAKEFRSDLYYRLNVVPLFIPPLRERQEAIIDFVYHFLSRYNQKYGLNKQIEPDAMDMLIASKWPGNVRQLSNTMERLVVMARGDVITGAEAEKVLHSSRDNNSACAKTPRSVTLKEAVDLAERDALLQALRSHPSSRAAARALGVNQSTVVRKAQRHGIRIGESSMRSDIG